LRSENTKRVGEIISLNAGYARILRNARRTIRWTVYERESKKNFRTKEPLQISEEVKVASGQESKHSYWYIKYEVLHLSQTEALRH